MLLRILTLSLLSILLWCCQPPEAGLPELKETAAQQPVQPSPNVVLILIDDLSPEALYSPDIATPNLDTMLARGAIRFDHCYAQPTCAPTRAKLLSGRHNARHPALDSLDAHPTIAGIFSKAGYQTGVIGKRHKVYTGQYNPNDLGFGWYSISFGDKSQPPGYLIHEPDTSYQYSIEEGYITKLHFDRAHDFVARNASQPFFLFMALRAAHYPFLPPPGYRDELPEEARYVSDPAHYPKILEYVDQQIGQLNRHLEALGLQHNTLLIITADNPSPKNVEFNESEGTKGEFTRAGTRVPLIAHWPEKITAPQSSDRLIGMEDFMPTFAELTGQAAQHDGISFLGEILPDRSASEKPFVLLGDHQPEAQFCLDTVLSVNQAQQLFKTDAKGTETPVAYEALSQTEQRQADRLMEYLERWSENRK
jgi:arylsulfatase A